MSVHAITPDYHGEDRDRVENFHGNQLVYVCWERHLLFSYPFAFAVAPDMTFEAFRNEVLGPAFCAHPEWSQIDWNKTEWKLGSEAFTPDPSKTLAEQGLYHKASLRFSTPDLKGIFGAAV